MSYVTLLLYSWHVSSICDLPHFYVIPRSHMWTHSICDMAYIYVIWLLNTWHVSWMCTVAHVYVTWRILMWYGSFARDVSHRYETWIYVCDVALSYVMSFICDMDRLYVNVSSIFDVAHLYMISRPCMKTYKHMYINMYIYNLALIWWVIRCIDIRRGSERWGAGVETQKNVRGEIGGWGRVPFNEPYAPFC